MPAPDLRASDAERERAVDILRVAAGDGRLTPAELDDRLGSALTARTIGELAALTADLPGGGMADAASRVRAASADGAGGDEPAVSRWAVLRSLLASQAGSQAGSPA